MNKSFLVLALIALLTDRAWSAPVTLPIISLTEANTEWQNINSGSGLALNIADAELLAPEPNRGDAFDEAFKFALNGTNFIPSTSADQSEVVVSGAVIGTEVSSAELTIGSLTAQQRFLFYRNAIGGMSLVRTLFRVTNSAPTTQSFSLSLRSNLGSDSGTSIFSTSAGSTAVNSSTKWSITSDATPTTGDPIVSHIVAGPECAQLRPLYHALEGDEYTTLFSHTIPSGGTVYFAAFLGLAETTAAADAATKQSFDTLAGLGSANLFADLSADIQSKILNFVAGGTCSSIGDTVWYDRDKDGVKDAAESGLEGAVVNLLTTADIEIASTVTNSAGAYSFTGLPTGSYRIQVERIGGFGLTYSPKDQGGDDARDSDCNTTNGITDTFTLGATALSSIDCGLYVEELAVQTNASIAAQIDTLTKRVKGLKSGAKPTVVRSLGTTLKDFVGKNLTFVELDSGKTSTEFQTAINNAVNASNRAANAANKRASNLKTLKSRAEKALNDALALLA